MAVEKYSNRSIWIHWVSAILIFLTIPTGLAMSETEATAMRLFLYKIHFVIGALVFLLALFHIYVYFKDERPPKIDTGNKFRNKLVNILHRILTILIIVLTITGVVSLFPTTIWSSTINNDYQSLPILYDSIFVTIHHIQGLIFIALIVLHVGGIVLHRVTKDITILQRMGIKF